MSLVPNGPLPDTRPVFFQSAGITRTVGPSRVLIVTTATTPAFPALASGIVLGSPTETVGPAYDRYRIIWRGYVGPVYFEARIVNSVDDLPEMWWEGFMDGPTPDLQGEWQGPVVPLVEQPLQGAATATVGDWPLLVIRSLSEWVDVADMFPAATLAEEV